METAPYSPHGCILRKQDLNRLIEALKTEGEIIAPKKEGAFIKMQPVETADEIELEDISWFSSKKYTFPENQILFTYENDTITHPKPPEKRVLFALRLCDLNAIMINDLNFIKTRPENRNYRNHRQNMTLVGLWCDHAQDRYCFCSSVNLIHYYDLCLFDRETHYHIKAGTEKGKKIIETLNLETEDYYPKPPECETKLNTTKIAQFFNKEDAWQKAADECLSCAACTFLCPTCLCYDIKDEPDIGKQSGKRTATWDFCTYRDFSKTADGKIYRSDRTARFRHRIYHKFTYFPDKFSGQLMCTGCGRCIRACPTKIDWIQLINSLESEKNA